MKFSTSRSGVIVPVMQHIFMIVGLEFFLIARRRHQSCVKGDEEDFPEAQAVA